jgi:glutamate dehydrogenase (NAD(P)+)
MAWIMDTYSQHKGHAVPEVVTGKPVAIGGTHGRREATGRGVVYTIIDAANHLGIGVTGCTAVVQGFGNVGSVVAQELARLGVRVIGVADRTGGYFDAKGLPVEKLLEVAHKNHSLEGCAYGKKITNEELLELKCDILVPAALEMQITKENAGRLQCRILAEGANGPTTLDADLILLQKDVFVIPDILANAGGVVVSYFEWVQDLQNFFWTEDEVNKKLRDILTKAFHEVLNLSLKENIDMRSAALMIGIERVAQAMLWRGLYA